MKSPSRFGALVILGVAAIFFNQPTMSDASTPTPAAGSVVLQVSDQNGTVLPGSGYFQITAAAGSRTQLYAVVGNAGSKAFAVSITAVDARSGVYGGVSYDLPQKRSRAVGSWIKLAVRSAKIAAGRAILVPFSVQVPAGTPGGQYIGGLTAYVPVSSSRTGKGAASNGAIVLQLRRVVAVVITVPGQEYGRFAVSRVNAKQRPDAVYLIAHIRNTGTMLVSGQGHLWMWKQGTRRAVLSVPIAVDVVVPRTTVLYPIHWASRPSAGKYSVTVTLSWAGGGKTTRKSSFIWTAPKR